MEIATEAEEAPETTVVVPPMVVAEEAGDTEDRTVTIVVGPRTAAAEVDSTIVVAVNATVDRLNKTLVGAALVGTATAEETAEVQTTAMEVVVGVTRFASMNAAFMVT